MQNNSYPGVGPTNNPEQNNPDYGAYPAQNTSQGAPGAGYQRQAVPVRRPPARRRPVMTNGYMFSFGSQQDNSQEEREQLELIAQRVRMNVQAQQSGVQPTQSAFPQVQPIVQPVVQSWQYGNHQQQYQQQTQQAQQAQKTGSRSSASYVRRKRPLSRAKRIRDSIMLTGMMIIFSFSAAFMLNSGARLNNAPTEQKSFFEDLNAEIVAFKSDSVSSIFDIPKGYILSWGEQPTPEPDPEGFGEYTDENGVRIMTYRDPTISVNYWTERHHGSSVHFADIKVAHPTQLRTAYAGGEFGSSVKYMPQEIARQVNAVVAVNADYCGYRTGGIIIRQNTMYRDTPRGWDILLIDSAGDFHIMEDENVYPSGIMDKYDIVNTLVFGPSLVVDGEVKFLNLQSGCGPTWGEKNPSPRTAVGQIGKMHYLFCCVEGRSDTSRGVLLSELGRIMLDKGCTQAYNLDGGQSTTMVFNGRAMNSPLWGSQRVVTDIIYCSTAIPNQESEAADE